VSGLEGIRPGEEIILITWLHQARRDVLQVHPRSDGKLPLAGVFATRFLRPPESAWIASCNSCGNR
jgi:tRNA (Thr-GGU) A37 N-methylase